MTYFYYKTNTWSTEPQISEETKDLWKNYAEVADQVGKHYNIIGVRWGKGSFGRVAWTGIKTAKVVKSFVEKYGLKVPDIHGIGFR